MDWVKLGIRYYFDAAIRGLDGDLADAAEVMFTRGLARAGEVGRAGFIPEQDVSLLARRRRYGAVVDALLRSGLWQAVPGGYQVRRWADWQDHLDALTRKRTADRERQRKRRAAAKDGESTVSRDMSRDVTAVEEEKEKEPKGGSAEGDHYAREAAEPPRRCTKHENTADPPRCGRCADARQANERWQAERRKRLAAAAKCAAHPDQLAANCSWCAAETKGVA